MPSMTCFNFWLAEEARLLDSTVFVHPFQLNYLSSILF